MQDAMNRSKLQDTRDTLKTHDTNFPCKSCEEEQQVPMVGVHRRENYLTEQVSRDESVQQLLNLRSRKGENLTKVRGRSLTFPKNRPLI